MRLVSEITRATLAILFVFTGVNHFTSTKFDLLAMVPAWIPGGLGLIYLTGVLEIAGGVGLLVPRTRRLAGAGLILLLIAMFPANVNAALNGIPFRGAPHPSLLLRTPIQLVLILGVWWTAVRTSQTANRAG